MKLCQVRLVTILLKARVSVFLNLSSATERPSPETRGNILVSLDMWGGTCRGVPPHLFLAYLGEELGNSLSFSSLPRVIFATDFSISADPGRSALPHSVSSGARVFVVLISVRGIRFLLRGTLRRAFR